MEPVTAFELADTNIEAGAATTEARQHLRWFFGPALRSGARRGNQTLRIDTEADPIERPRRDPDSFDGPVERWDESDHTVIWHESGRGAEVAGHRITIGAPNRSDTDVWRSTRQLLAEGLATWFGWRGATVIHAAHIGADGDGLIVLGPTGSGKSTVAATALAGDWDLHGDDLAIVRRHSGGASAHGIPKRPSFDPLISDALPVPLSPADGDERGRLTASSDRLTSGWTSIRALVRVEHDLDDGAVWRLEHADAMNAIFASTFGAHDRLHSMLEFPTLARLAGLPAYQVRLASSPDHRIDHLRHALSWIWADAGETQVRTPPLE